MDKKISKIQYELIQEKLLLLFESVESIGNIKKLEDKFEIKCGEYDDIIKEYKFETTQLKLTCKEQVMELDKLKSDMKDLIDKNIRIQKEKDFQY